MVKSSFKWPLSFWQFLILHHAPLISILPALNVAIRYPWIFLVKYLNLNFQFLEKFYLLFFCFLKTFVSVLLINFVYFLKCMNFQQGIRISAIIFLNKK